MAPWHSKYLWSPPQNTRRLTPLDVVNSREKMEYPPLWVVLLFIIIPMTFRYFPYSYWSWLILYYNPGSGSIWATWSTWCLPWIKVSISDRTAWIPRHSWGNIPINTPLFLLSWIPWPSWVCWHIYIGSWCCFYHGKACFSLPLAILHYSRWHQTPSTSPSPITFPTFFWSPRHWIRGRINVK